LDRAAVIVLFISRNSVERTGYVQRELKIALDKLQERPLHRIYAIPVLLDSDLPIPDVVKHLHCVALDKPENRFQLLDAIRNEFDQLGRSREQIRRESDIEWSFGSIKETWDGLPGYDLEISWPIYRSRKFPNVSQVGEIIKGDLLLALARERHVKLEQEHDSFSFGQDKWRRTNSYSAKCGDPVIQNSVLSQHVAIHWYGAGAPHPNYTYRSWVFVLDPFVPVETLESVFENPDKVLALIQAEARRQILEEIDQRLDKKTRPKNRKELFVQEVEKGTANWDAFGIFKFESNGISLLFPPYQVAAYAAGSFGTVINYEMLAMFLKRPYADALGIRRLSLPAPFLQKKPLEPVKE
jgi:hypothetical protein